MICHIKVKGGCLVIGHAFDGKVVLITGASRGIGRALAIQLAERGAKVVINYRKNQDEAKAVAQKICELGSEALLCQADMEHEEQIQSMFAEIRRKYGRLDIFVANAAATAFKPLMEVKAHHIRRTFAISVDGFIFAVQQAVPLMKEGGRIVGVSGFDSIRYLQNHGVLGLASLGIRQSFSAKGCPYDNAPMESFHAILKKELVYQTIFKSYEEAKSQLFHIEGRYNRHRIHSGIGYKTPQQMEDFLSSVA